MKKFLFIIFALTLCLFAISFQKPEVSADTENKGELISSEIEYFEDGSYLVTEYYSISKTSNARSNMRIVTHTAVVTEYSATNKVLWIYELIGDWFVEDGISVQAAASVVNTTINGSGWSFHELEATYAGAKVHGGGNFKFKVLGVVVKTINMDINMECDVYGELI